MLPVLSDRSRIPLRTPRRILIVTALLAGLALAPVHRVAAQNRAASVNAGTIVYADARSAGDIDPASDQTASFDVVARTVAEPLIAFKGASVTQYKPILATRWATNHDQSVYTFYLRHGVRFHTGRCCLSAEDVQYSIARTVTLQLAASYVLGRFITNPAKQIKILNPYTVQFDLGRPQPLFLGAVASYYTGLILDSHALKAHDVHHDMGHAWVQYHDAGTGPYTIQSWTHGQQVVLTRFAPYWGGWSGSHFSKVVDRTVPEAATRRELVERGNADLVGLLTPQDYDQLKSTHSVRVVVGPTAQVDYLVFNQSGPLASPAARQALSYAFPYNAYIQAAYRSYAKRAYGPLASTLLGYDPHMFHYQTDLVKAKALLAKAGIKAGTTLTYSYVSGLQNFQIAGELLQAQLAQLGVTLKLQALDQATNDSLFYSSTAPSKRPNIMGNRWWPDYNDPYDESVPLVASYSAGASGANGGYYNDKRVDALLGQMKTASHEALLSEAARLQDITGRQDPPNLWLDEPAQVVVAASNLKGLVINPVTIETYDFYSMHR